MMLLAEGFRLATAPSNCSARVWLARDCFLGVTLAAIRLVAIPLVPALIADCLEDSAGQAALARGVPHL
jgi:hypothetical protein